MSLDAPDYTLLKTVSINDVGGFGVSAPNYLLFAENRTLLAQAIDVQAKALTGEPVRVAEGIEQRPPSSAFSASVAGALAYSSGSFTFTLSWARNDGVPVDTEVRTWRRGCLPCRQTEHGLPLDVRHDTPFHLDHRAERSRNTRDLQQVCLLSRLVPGWVSNRSGVGEGRPTQCLHHESGREATGSTARADDSPGQLSSRLVSGWPIPRFWVQIPRPTRTSASPVVADRSPRPLVNTAFNEWRPRFPPMAAGWRTRRTSPAKPSVYSRAFPRAALRRQFPSRVGSHPGGRGMAARSTTGSRTRSCPWHRTGRAPRSVRAEAFVRRQRTPVGSGPELRRRARRSLSARA